MCRGGTSAEPKASQPDNPELGTLSADHLDHVDADRFGRVIEAAVDAEGEQVALYTDDVLEDVVVEQGTMDPEGEVFTPEHELLRVKKLTSDMLLVIHTYFTDTVPTLRVQYTGANGPEWRYLFQSGKDGSILLLEQ